MAGTEVAGVLHIANADPVVSRLDHDHHHHNNNNHHHDDPNEHTDHGENASSGSNDDIIGDHSPSLSALGGSFDGAGEIPIHRCDKCENYETLSRAALISHMARCLNNNNDGDSDGARRGDRKLFECDVCSMKFSNGANMRRHKMRHTGVKPYECRVCQKRFFRKDHLAEHFTTHTKTLPYHCPICNRGFQRQIAMRAHFQNEHVGQHDMIKSCPLCTFRAGTMKSLRVHFFNRHGIDLDNPATGPPALVCLREAAAAAAASKNAEGTNSSVPPPISSSTGGGFTDSGGESQGARSADNVTPPMHFLTPHVEISMTDADASPYSPGQSDSANTEHRNGDLSSSSPTSGESSHNMTSNSSINVDIGGPASPASIGPASPPPINLSSMPALTVIPIVKQELLDNDEIIIEKRSPIIRQQNGPTNGPMNLSKSISPTPQNLTTSPSLIKVSPLKTLLRDDLKRKLTTRNSIRGRLPPQAHEPPPPVNMSLIRDLNLPAAITQQLASLQEEPNGKKDGQGGHMLPQTLQCVFCGIWFPDQTLYFLHKGCHCDSNPWKCNICGEQCGNVYQFNSHLLSNTHQ